MTDILAPRGKRQTARAAGAVWVGLTAFAFWATVFADAQQYQLDALRELHGAATYAIAFLVFSLLGLDTAQAQILPRLRNEC